MIFTDKSSDKIFNNWKIKFFSACNKLSCPGPLKYYEEIGCKEVAKNENNCCPKYYDCSHLEKRENDKCYVNNNVYNLGDKLKDEDKKPCDVGCTCQMGGSGK